VCARGALANPHTTKTSHRYTQSANQIDQVRRVWPISVVSISIVSARVISILVISWVLLAFIPCAMGEGGDEHSQSVSQYAISVQRLQVSPKARAHLVKARREFGKLDLPGAAMEVERALLIAPRCAQAFTMRAFIELASSKFDSAMADALRATALDPNDALSFLTLATAENSRGEFGQAATAAQQALRTQPDLWQAHLEIAKAFYGQEQFGSALRELDSFKIDFPDVHLVRANVLVRMGRTQEAAGEFAAFLEESPHDLRNERIKKIVAGINETAARQ
jgi:tetratricopeptide (TPR) repeat protein